MMCAGVNHAFCSLLINATGFLNFHKRSVCETHAKKEASPDSEAALQIRGGEGLWPGKSPSRFFGDGLSVSLWLAICPTVKCPMRNA